LALTDSSSVPKVDGGHQGMPSSW